ncbi:ankyrin repeat-containing domain protein [Cyathus striatus]|nr:ankyrin repeat-containing domain protein [Cyathus striatus]
MKPYLSKKGYLSKKDGAQQVRIAYRNGSVHFSYEDLSEFGKLCYAGLLEAVKVMVETGLAPDLKGTELPYQFGYATLVVAGSQRVSSDNDESAPRLKHYKTLEYLISQGVPLDKPDIVGLTPLHHALQGKHKIGDESYVRLLLKSGASVNYRNRYGENPLLFSLPAGNADSVDVLMGFGADLDMADAEGGTPRLCYLGFGPQVTAVIQKWIRKRNGEDEAPRSEKACAACGEKEKPLKNCAKCQVARYCSRECQRSHWPTHKKSCKPFNAANTVTLKPTYNHDIRTLVPMSKFMRAHVGAPDLEAPASHSIASNVPKDLSAPKPIVIKVQVPMGAPTGDMMVYTKKRDFVCTIRRVDEPKAYDAVSRMVREKGVGGLKAYFVAELRGKDELVVKVAEVLAEQPF